MAALSTPDAVVGLQRNSTQNIFSNTCKKLKSLQVINGTKDVGQTNQGEKT